MIYLLIKNNFKILELSSSNYIPISNELMSSSKLQEQIYYYLQKLIICGENESLKNQFCIFHYTQSIEFDLTKLHPTLSTENRLCGNRD